MMPENSILLNGTLLRFSSNAMLEGYIRFCNQFKRVLRTCGVQKIPKKIVIDDVLYDLVKRGDGFLKYKNGDDSLVLPYPLEGLDDQGYLRSVSSYLKSVSATSTGTKSTSSLV